MKTDLNQEGSSLFRKSKKVLQQVQNSEIERSANGDYTDIDDLVDRTMDAIKNRKEEDLPYLQVELQMWTLVFLKMIDWKMWEIHNKFVK